MDVVEWCVDFFEDVKDLVKVEVVLDEICIILLEILILFIFCSVKEGGELVVGDEFYFELNEILVSIGKIDLVDVEFFNEEMDVLCLIEIVYKNNVKVVMLNYDFDKIFVKEEIVFCLICMEVFGVDFLKIVVMLKFVGDVLILLDVMNIVFEKVN